MGKHQRDKGNRGEREAVEVLETIGLEARKRSGMYVEGPDIVTEGDFMVEVKRRNTSRGFSLIDNLLADAINDIVMVRADRAEWVVAMRPEALAELLDYVRSDRLREMLKGHRNDI